MARGLLLELKSFVLQRTGLFVIFICFHFVIILSLDFAVSDLVTLKNDLDEYYAESRTFYLDSTTEQPLTVGDIKERIESFDSKHNDGIYDIVFYFGSAVLFDEEDEIYEHDREILSSASLPFSVLQEHTGEFADNGIPQLYLNTVQNGMSNIETNELQSKIGDTVNVFGEDFIIAGYCFSGPYTVLYYETLPDDMVISSVEISLTPNQKNKIDHWQTYLNGVFSGYIVEAPQIDSAGDLTLFDAIQVYLVIAVLLISALSSLLLVKFIINSKRRDMAVLRTCGGSRARITGMLFIEFGLIVFIISLFSHGIWSLAVNTGIADNWNPLNFGSCLLISAAYTVYDLLIMFPILSKYSKLQIKELYFEA